MLDEDRAAKKKIVDSLEHHTKLALKLCKELGIRYHNYLNSKPVLGTLKYLFRTPLFR
jgi:hypothetical protein